MTRILSFSPFIHRNWFWKEIRNWKLEIILLFYQHTQSQFSLSSFSNSIYRCFVRCLFWRGRWLVAIDKWTICAMCYDLQRLWDFISSIFFHDFKVFQQLATRWEQKRFNFFLLVCLVTWLGRLESENFHYITSDDVLSAACRLIKNSRTSLRSGVRWDPTRVGLTLARRVKSKSRYVSFAHISFFSFIHVVDMPMIFPFSQAIVRSLQYCNLLRCRIKLYINSTIVTWVTRHKILKSKYLHWLQKFCILCFGIRKNFKGFNTIDRFVSRSNSSFSSVITRHTSP